MDALPGAKALACSNPSPFLLNAVRVAALMFPDMERVRECSWLMTQLCRQLLQPHAALLEQKGIRIITPLEKERSGAQLSFYFENSNAKDYFNQLHERKVPFIKFIGRLLGT